MQHRLTRRSLLAAITAAGGTALGKPTVAAATQPQRGWPYAKHDPANTNYGPDIAGPRENEIEESIISVSGPVNERLVATAGSVYLGHGDTIAAYDIADGTEQWTWKPPGVSLSGEPVGHTGQLLFTGMSGFESMVGFLDPSSGEGQRELRGQNRMTVTPTPEGIYLSEANFLSAVDESGREQWQQSFEQPIIGSAVAGDRLYVAVRGAVVAVQRGDGTVQWRESVRTFSEPAAANGRVFVAGESLTAFDSEDGSSLWQAAELPVVTTVPAVADDQIYVGAGGDDAEETFFAVDVETGEIEWQTRLGGTAVPTSSPATTRPAATGELVYVGSNRTMHGIDAETGEIEWRTTAQGTVGPPVPVNGRVLFTTSENKVMTVSESQDESATAGQSGAEDDESSPTQGETNDTNDETTEDSQGESSNSDDGSGPGFGIPAGLTALGGVGYLLRRLGAGHSGEFGEEMDQRKQQDDTDQ